MFYFFKGFFSNKLKKLFCIVGGIVIFLFASLAIAISFDRFGEKLIFSIASYFGEPFLNFPLIYWNYPNFFEGKVILSEIFGGSSFYIPIGIDFFKTLPGSIYLDFGIVGTLIFLIIYALIGRLFLGSFKENITLSQLYVYTFLYQGLIFGAFSFDVYNWKSYFMMFLIYLFLRVTKRETVYE